MDERPAGAGAPAIKLNATEDQILAYIRAGLVDAEIAVRMGLSNGDVKGRVERLAAKMGVEGREGLRGRLSSSESQGPETALVDTGSVPSPGYAPRLAVGIAGGLAVAFVVGLGAGWLLGDRSDSTAAPDPSGDRAEQTPSAPTPTPEVARLQEFDGRRMEYAGTLLDSALPFIVVDWSDREGLTAVWLSRPGFINLTTDVVEWTPVEGGSILAGFLGDLRFELHLFAGQATQLLRGETQIAVYTTSTTDQRPLLLLFAVGPDGGRHPVHLDPRGRLYIASSPLPPSTVLESQTGEAIEMTSLIPSSKLSVGDTIGWFFTNCRDQEACTVSHYPYPGGLKAPFSGRVTCPDTSFSPPLDLGREAGDQVLTLSNDIVALSFWRLVMTGPNGPRPGSICSSRETAVAGEDLLPAGQYMISARRPDGAPLDVGVALDGTLFVGEAEPKVGCPCLGGR